MSVRVPALDEGKVYVTTYHVDGYRLADAFRPQPGWGTRRFKVSAADLGEHTEQQVLEAARANPPERHHLTSVVALEDGVERVIWSEPAVAFFRGVGRTGVTSSENEHA